MPSNQTANYALNQWSKDDRVLMEDFNADNAKIDGVLGEHGAALAALTTAAPKLGNCQIYYGSYVGDGTYGESAPSSLSFDYPPVLVMIMNVNGGCTVMVRDNLAGPSDGRNFFHVSWSGNTVFWYSSYDGAQMNYDGWTYRWVALCSKS